MNVLNNPVTPVSVEVNDKGEAIAFAFDWPGACGWGASLKKALEKLEDDITWTQRWLVAHGLGVGLPERYPLTVVEQVEATGHPLECDPEGFFRWDMVPYSDDDLMMTRRLLGFSRGDLMGLVKNLPPEILDFRLYEGKRTIGETIGHIASAERWYTTRMLPDPSTARPLESYGPDVFTRLASIREMFFQEYLPRLESLPPSRRGEVFCHAGETWTARKTLRRAVWHELLHYKQLAQWVPAAERALTRLSTTELSSHEA